MFIVFWRLKMQSFEHICDRSTPLSPMTLDNYSQSIVLILTKNMSTIVIVTAFQLWPFNFSMKSNNQRLYTTCIAWHCHRVPTFAHQLPDLSKCMSSDSPCNLYLRVTRQSRHERYIKNDNNTTHISLLPFEFPLKSSDLYRISPNIPQTICHPSKGEIGPLN